MLAAFVICATAAQLPPLTPKTVDEYLPALQAEEPDYLKRVETIAAALLGVPYATDPLGEGPNAGYDTDPLIDLLHVNAVTYVEQCLALAAARSLEEATRDLTEIRYIAGQVEFTRRNHFLVADWVINNAFVTQITQELGVPTRPFMRFIDRRGYFKETKAAELYRHARVEGITIHYIWHEEIEKIEPNIPNGSLLVFVGRKADNIGAHCGLYFRSDDAEKGTLYHASAIQNRAVMSSLMDAVRQDQNIIGLLVYRIHPERMAFLEDAADIETEGDAAASAE